MLTEKVIPTGKEQKKQQRDSKPQPLSSETNTQPFSQTGQCADWSICRLSPVAVT